MALQHFQQPSVSHSDRNQLLTDRGIPVTMGSDAVRLALAQYGNIKRISVITPYMPVGDQQVVRFFNDCGFEIVALHGFKCNSPVNIAHVSEKQMRDALIQVNDPSVDAIVQVGTNLAMPDSPALHVSPVQLLFSTKPSRNYFVQSDSRRPDQIKVIQTAGYCVEPMFFKQTAGFTYDTDENHDGGSARPYTCGDECTGRRYR